LSPTSSASAIGLPPGTSLADSTSRDSRAGSSRCRMSRSHPIELYQWLLDRHIGPTFAGKALAAIAPPAVRTWHAGAARMHPTTAAKAYRLFSSIMRSAVSDQLIHRNPCQVRGAAVEKAPERPIATIAEVDALAEAMPPSLRIAVALAAWCQLRRGEVRGLRRRDVDLMQGTLAVSITKTTSMSGQAIIKEPKTRAGRRTVAIPPHIVNLLAHHLDRHVGESQAAVVIEGSNRSLSVAWGHACSTLGRADLRFHDVRRSGLTWSAATRASIAELMRRAGHASQTAALRYQHATDDRDRAIAQVLTRLADQSQADPWAGGGPEAGIPSSSANVVRQTNEKGGHHRVYEGVRGCTRVSWDAPRSISATRS
jgi:integrase